ncbi:MAG: hypothetical protein JST92_15195 [Deltaproteobacteria bacterium]|nr:hypothetical protein [Deltaproteobacteria bacterium]
MDDAPRLEEGPLLSRESVQEFFKGQLDLAIDRLHVRVDTETQGYVVRLLAAFATSDELFSRDDSGQLQQRPLAFLLKDALDEQGPARVQLLRKLGDQSLFVSGFFAEWLDQRSPSVDYYIAMGERAYDAVGGAVARTGGSKKSVFSELSAKFGQLVDLLNEVSERTRVCTDRGLVRLYDRFLRTGSQRLAGLLRDQGVLAPVVVPSGRLLS